jgi:hypothetical protein
MLNGTLLSACKALSATGSHTSHAIVRFSSVRTSESAQLTPSPSVVVTKELGYSVLTLNKPRSLNALSQQLMQDVTEALDKLDKDDSVKCIIVASASEKAFAAGADIKDMATQSYASMERLQFFKRWDKLQDVRKPIIAAVNGYALGGGFELALMCDIVIASDKAQFGLVRPRLACSDDIAVPNAEPAQAPHVPAPPLLEPRLRNPIRPPSPTPSVHPHLQPWVIPSLHSCAPIPTPSTLFTLHSPSLHHIATAHSFHWPESSSRTNHAPHRADCNSSGTSPSLQPLSGLTGVRLLEMRLTTSIAGNVLDNQP